MIASPRSKRWACGVFKHSNRPNPMAGDHHHSGREKDHKQDIHAPRSVEIEADSRSIMKDARSGSPNCEAIYIHPLTGNNARTHDSNEVASLTIRAVPPNKTDPFLSMRWSGIIDEAEGGDCPLCNA